VLKKLVIADLDPQANLTAAFLREDKIAEAAGSTIYRCVEPLAGVGDIAKPDILEVVKDLYLLPGDVSLSGYEGTLSDEWPKSIGDNNLYRPMRILSSFWQVMQDAASSKGADINSNRY
jgi:chromosome partitioning protein